MEIKLGELTKRQLLYICDDYSKGSIHCSKSCPLYRENKVPLCKTFDEKDLNIKINLKGYKK